MAYTQVTFGTLKANVTDRLGANSTFWSDQEKGDAINEAIQIWQAATGQWKSSFSFTPVYEHGNFTNVPRQIVSIQRVVTTSPLEYLGLEETDNGFVGWQGSTGTAGYWAPAGINKMVIYPAQTTSVRVEGMTNTPRMRTDSEYIDIGEEELTRLLEYAIGYLSFKEGPTESTYADGTLKQLLDAAVLKNKRLKATALYRKFMGIDDNVRERPSQMPELEGAR